MRGIGVPLLGGCIEWNVALSEIHAKASFIWRRKAYPASGITNRVLDENGETIGYVLFGDYDHTTLADVEQRINEARKKIVFGDAYILRSGRDSFHVIIPTVHDFGEAVYFTALTDSGHDLTLFQKEHELTLRITPKNGLPIRFTKTLPNFDSRLRISYSHMLYLCMRFQEIDEINLLATPSFHGGELEIKNYYYYNR